MNSAPLIFYLYMYSHRTQFLLITNNVFIYSYYLGGIWQEIKLRGFDYYSG